MHKSPGTLISALCGLVVSIAAGANAADAVDFERDIQPVLAEHCFHCHGQDAQGRKAELRLDKRDAALHGGKSHQPAIVPGKTDRGELLARLTSSDPDKLMPPPKAKKPMKPADIENIRRWIADGATYSDHWAFVPPVKAPLPKTPGVNSDSPIDAFVADRLSQEGMKLSEPADPQVLCRRLWLDLVGFPPAPADLDAFAKQATDSGLSAAVDSLTSRLLQSPHFGEKWARPWLDAARYADSNGYEKDLPRDQWAWRDWVINAINRDMPYDRFLIEQIAGDLLPNHTQAQQIATGYLRCGMTNEEGAIVPELFRMDGMFDKIDCIGKSIFGMSLQCGQCHSHKFDPFSQNDYYGLFAFLNNTYETQLKVYSSAQQKKISDIRARLKVVEDKARCDCADWKQQFADWQKGVLERDALPAWEPIEPTDLHSSTGLNHPTALPDKSVLTLGHRTINGDLLMTAEPELQGATGLRFEALTHGDLPFGGPGRSFKGTWAITELIVESQAPGKDKWEKLKLKNASADFSEPNHVIENEWAFENSKDKDKDKRQVGSVNFMIDGKDDTAWRADRGTARRNSESVAVVQFDKPLELAKGTKLRFSIRLNHGGNDNGPKNAMIGRFRMSLTKAANPKAEPVDYAAIIALRTPPEERTEEQKHAIFQAWVAATPALKQYHKQIESVWKEYPEAETTVLCLTARTGQDVRSTYRLDRGVWDRRKEEVKAHVPEALGPALNEENPNRLSLARWLTDRRTPLTARVEVNRIWQGLFGRGIVETAEDFGTRAPVPEYRSLLDWLAVDFMEHGWSKKRLIRTIVSSRVYQQTSHVSKPAYDRDPGNRFLARAPRFRPDAELVRDMVLGTAGLLTDQVGGPSFFPPVPESVLNVNYFKPTYWVAPQGAERYRRSLYMFRKRSMPDPTLSVFDAPNGDVACARRVRSNTPLAALASLNEPVFVEAAQALAIRILKEGGSTDSDRAAFGFRLCTARTPSAAEVEQILAVLKDVRPKMADGWLSVREIATGDGNKLPKLPPGATPQDAAAWTIASRVLLNLDETLCKN